MKRHISESISTNRLFVALLSILCISIPLPKVTATDFSSGATTSTQHKNVQKIYKGDGDAVVEVKIPERTSFKDAYPNTKNVADSTEFHDENERIASNSTMISGVKARFRSGRAYPMELPNRYNQYRRYYTNRNTIDSDGSSWSGKWLNNLRRRTSMIMSPASSYDNQGYQTQQQEAMTSGMAIGEEPDMAATFLGSGGGHGGGYGSSGGYGKGVNKSAVGLLGFLSLLSLIQNVLNQTNMAMGRKRRDVSGMGEFDANYDWQDGVTETVVLSPLALPILNAVKHAENGVIPAECTLQPICLANHFLVENLGERGKSLGMTLSTEFQNAYKKEEMEGKWLGHFRKSDTCRNGRTEWERLQINIQKMP